MKFEIRERQREREGGRGGLGEMYLMYSENIIAKFEWQLMNNNKQTYSVAMKRLPIVNRILN